MLSPLILGLYIYIFAFFLMISRYIKYSKNLSNVFSCWEGQRHVQKTIEKEDHLDAG